MRSSFHVIHVVSGLAKASGGPSRSVVGLAEHIAKSGVNVTLLTQYVEGEEIISPDPQLVHFCALKRGTVFDPYTGVKLALCMNKLLNESNPAIVHGHGIWSTPSVWAGILAKRHAVKMVLHPRGMLEPWCLNYKSTKKKVAMKLYQRRILANVDLFVATSVQELESIRALGLRQPVAVIPNGVELPSVKYGGRKRENKKQALFLSRIHPVKGLLNLINAWSQVEPRGWELVVAGPDEDDYWSEIERRIRALGIGHCIKYVGPVEGTQKDTLFRESDLFVLPSFSENFGIVIAEALAYGLPVITTKGTPWSAVVNEGCGWWVEPTVECISAALEKATSAAPESLAQMGGAARKVASRYDWQRIAQKMGDSYQWLLGRASKPECIVSN